ncbi:uncharacterized protein STEHIDRAFT_138450 [Stereum hirsutum FP-91666 SS1]|uniref:uncharacterized protein n=1 Tax=Stereum hirsutum (strain FP-91666) TaxID=721885 RepID=UPI000440BA9F|nr:uncharacterized protein STEHIDRAFT_138450 [Stereum hirsutum FP-91666 SS1]EIM87934.1 hypothetical protein STEHIDRAFT_138450 [Stereum hirsutum FP-91666 SS1]
MPEEEGIRLQYTRRRYDPSQRGAFEIWWVGHQPWLEQSGYALRPRFRKDWQPSWKGQNKQSSKLFEDGQQNHTASLIDATRLTDGSMVFLKHHKANVSPAEVDIGRLFSSEPLASDPRNHCVPFIDVLPVPEEEGEHVIVTPLLRPWNSPSLETYGEAVAFLSQIFEGIQFMHEHHVAHRDCTCDNIMMDASSMYPQGFHPAQMDRSKDWKGKAKHLTRTQAPPRYLLIDFGHARRYDPKDGPPLELPLRDGDKSAPEHSEANYNTPCDPFPTDIYYLGNFMRKELVQRSRGFEFLHPLVQDMVKTEPSERPKMDEVVVRFKKIVDSLSWWKLRSRIVGKKHFSALLKNLTLVPGSKFKFSLRGDIAPQTGGSQSLTMEEEHRRWLKNPGILSRHERVWRSRQKWLEERGYMLRSRYKPDWVPSWTGTKKWFDDCADGQGNPADNISELDIMRSLSSEPLASDPRNNCNPLLDVLSLPDPQDGVLVVTLMLRPFDNPRFETFGEAVAFFSQIFVGLQFLHEYHIAHRDCTSGNIMMEPTMFPKPYHPIRIERRRDWKSCASCYTRTECPPRYLFIDLGLSTHYPSGDGPHFETPLRGGDK